MEHQVECPSDQLFRTIADTSPDAIFVVNARGKICYWNDAATRLLGYSLEEVIGSAPPPDMSGPLLDDALGQSSGQSMPELAASSEADMASRWCESKMTRKNGSTVWVDRLLNQVCLEEQTWRLVVLRDAEDRKRREFALKLEATTDPLSGLANRRQFQTDLEKNLHRSLTIAMLDVDHFKLVNDTHGHSIGDEVIQRIANELREHFKEDICIGRLGGDEFGLILHTDSTQAVLDRMENVRSAIERTAVANGEVVTASIGVAISPTSGCSARTLLTEADKALYRSKSMGRNQVQHTVLP